MVSKITSKRFSFSKLNLPFPPINGFEFSFPLKLPVPSNKKLQLS